MKNYNGADNTSNILEAFSASARPTLSIDVAKYQEYLDGAELTPEQKDEFLQAMWSIVVTFVELGYGVHPLQEACGKDAEVLDCASKQDSNGSISQQQEELRRPDDGPKRG